MIEYSTIIVEQLGAVGKNYKLFLEGSLNQYDLCMLLRIAYSQLLFLYSFILLTAKYY